MNRIILLFFILFGMSLLANGQDKDTTKPQKVEVKISVENKSDSLKENVAKSGSQVCKTCNPGKVNKEEWILVLLPTIFFLLLFYYFMGWLKKDNFKISEALSSCDPLTLTQQTKDNDGTVTGTAATQVLPKSSSRLIAFLTAVTAMVIAICLTTYYIFITLADCPNPDLDGLWKIIASLGIGIIPYGANMWKESKKDNNNN